MRSYPLCLPLLVGASLAGCSSSQNSTPTPVISPKAVTPAATLNPTQAARTKALKTLVNAMTGNAGEARQKARDLLAESDALLKARDFNGAMEKRLQMLQLRGNADSVIGLLTGYAIQRLALDHLARIASQLDATSSRNFARKFEAADKKMPSYADVLRMGKASALKDLALYTRKPGDWGKLATGMGFNAADTATLRGMTPEQVKANITKLYDARIAEASKPYSPKSAYVKTDPYTEKIGNNGSLLRFAWTESKMERVFAIAGLDRKADFQERHPRVGPLPADPFGNGPLKEKAGMVYSVGPDGVDDGNPNVEATMVRPDTKGDIYMPLFSPRDHNAPAFN